MNSIMLFWAVLVALGAMTIAVFGVRYTRIRLLQAGTGNRRQFERRRFLDRRVA